MIKHNLCVYIYAKINNHNDLRGREGGRGILYMLYVYMRMWLSYKKQ